MSRSIRLVSSKIPSQVVRLALLALFPLMAMPWTAGAQSQDPYRQLKYVENQIPPPPAYTVLPVLSVDAKLGRISCPLVSRRVWLGGLVEDDVSSGASSIALTARTRPGSPASGPRRKVGPFLWDNCINPDPDTFTEVFVNAFDIGLKFDVPNRGQAPFEVTVNGVSTVVPPGQDSVTINVKNADTVAWSMKVGSMSGSCCRYFQDGLHIKRVHAGGLTISVIPLGIVYEPPQDSSNKNTASYGGSTIIGTETSLSFGSVSTSSQPKQTGFENVNKFKSEFRQVASIVSDAAQVAQGIAKVDPPSDPAHAYVDGAAVGLSQVASGLKAVSGALDTLLGTAEAHEDTRQTSDEAHGLQIVDTSSTVRETGTHKGPGRGDRIIYIKDVRLAYLAYDGRISLVPLGKGRVTTLAASELLDDLEAIRGKTAPVGLDGVPIGPLSRLKKETIEALLNLDPLVRNPTAALSTVDSPRFIKQESFMIGGGHDTYSWKHMVTNSDKITKTTVSTFVEDMHAGLLSYFGIGVGKDIHINSTTTQTSSEERSVGTEVSVQADFYAGANEAYSIDAYYDRLFGTFAFVKVPVGDEVIGGTLSGSNNQALAGRLVTLDIGGHRFVARTDSSGRYSFRAGTIPTQGQGLLAVPGLAGVAKAIQLTPMRGQRHDLRP